MGSTCRREGATPTDDGTMIVDCEVHGEVGRARTGGTVDRTAPGEFEAVGAVWADHLRSTAGS